MFRPRPVLRFRNIPFLRKNLSRKVKPLKYDKINHSYQSYHSHQSHQFYHQKPLRINNITSLCLDISVVISTSIWLIYLFEYF